MHFIHSLQAFIALHPALVYGAFFFVSMIESLALIGLLVPGAIILFSMGAIVATGGLELKWVLLLAIIGAITGDGISYWLGHHYQKSLRYIWPFSRYPAILTNGEAFFVEHGGKSVLIGRFVGPMRPIIPMIAGMLGMKPLYFVPVNILAAMGWALVYILPGVFLGTSLAVAGEVSMRLAVLISTLVAIGWFIVWLTRKIVKLIERRGPVWLEKLDNRISTDSGYRIFRPVKQLLSYLFLGPQEDALCIGLLVVLLIISGWSLLGILEDVLTKDQLVIADQSVYHFFQMLRTPWGDSFFVAITEFADSFVAGSLVLVVLFILLIKRCYRTALFWTLAVLSGSLSVECLKGLIHLPRPVSLYHGPSTYGFPSGHTCMSVILYGFLAIILARGRSRTQGWLSCIIAIMITLTIALSRLYLGAHWLSDVLGGLMLGTCWMALLGIAYLKGPIDPVPRRKLALAGLLIIIGAGGGYISMHHAKDMAFYAPRHEVVYIAQDDWLTNGWREIPTWRIDLSGEQKQPLTIQWCSVPGKVKEILLTKGWQNPLPLSVKSFLSFFSPETPIETLPVLPRLHDGQIDTIRLVHVDKEQRWVMRLWPANISIIGGKTSLFVGTIEVQDRHRHTGLITAAKETTNEYDLVLNQLAATIQDKCNIKRVSRTASEMDFNEKHHRVQWQGSILLIWEKTQGE